MPRLIVKVNKLNKRKVIPHSLADKGGIIGFVNKGFVFEGEPVPVTDPALGKWYQDRDGYFYWGEGFIVEQTALPINLPGMPVNLPANFRLGIDVSHHNANPDWNAFKNAGVSFVFIKISEGVGTRDQKAKENANNARAKGLKIGYYHFCRPDSRNGGSVISDATAEANEALQIMLGLQTPDLPLVLDLEEWGAGKDSPLGPADYLTWISTFIKTVTDELNKGCIIYSRKNYLEQKLPSNHNLGNIKLWLAYYPEKPDCNKVAIPKGWSDWSIWQYTEHGAIGGNPQLDINILKDSSLF